MAVKKRCRTGIKLRRPVSRLGLRRECGYKFFEARVAAKRIPLRVELEFAVSDTSWNFRGNGELFERQIFHVGPGVNHREVGNVGRAIHRVLADWQQFAGAAAFADSVFFAAKAGIDQSKPAPGRSVVGLIVQDLFFDGAGRVEGRSRFSFISKGSGGEADKPVACPKRIIISIAQSFGADGFKGASD